MIENETFSGIFPGYPANSSVWVYNSSNPLSSDQLEMLNRKLDYFVQNWKSHGSPLKADFSLFKNQFVIFIVHPDSIASGCSIDGSVHLLKSLEAEFQTEFLNNAIVPIQLNDNTIINIPFLEAKKEVKLGKLGLDAKVYNLAVRNLEEFRSSFQINLADSFLKNSLPV